MNTDIKWYVLYTLTGKELAAMHQLREHGIDCMVLQKAVMIRRGGHWHEETQILFPGYVFVHMAYSAVVHYTIKGISGAVQLLPKGGAPEALSEKEVAWLLSLCGNTLTLSKVDFSGAKPIVVEGPLKGMEHFIVKLDCHRRQALLRIPVLGEDKTIALDFLPVLNNHPTFKCQQPPEIDSSLGKTLGCHHETETRGLNAIGVAKHAQGR